MVTQKTAEKIMNICIEIDCCKYVLSLFPKVTEDSDFSICYISPPDSKEKRESESVAIAADIAKEALEKQLGVLEAEYKALNDKAIQEAKDDGCSEI
jgi:hypothetical protein